MTMYDEPDEETEELAEKERRKDERTRSLVIHRVLEDREYT